MHSTECMCVCVRWKVSIITHRHWLMVINYSSKPTIKKNYKEVTIDTACSKHILGVYVIYVIDSAYTLFF